MVEDEGEGAADNEKVRHTHWVDFSVCHDCNNGISEVFVLASHQVFS